MIPDHIKPLLRKTIILNGTILDVKWTDSVKRDRITPRSSPNKRYYEYLLSNIRMENDDTILLHRCSVKWIKTDIPFKLKNNNRIRFKGRITPCFMKDKAGNEYVTYKITNTKFVGRYTI